MTLDSKAKWTAILALALADCIWILCTGFRVDRSYFLNLGWLSPLLLIALFYFYTGRDQRIAYIAHFAAQLVALFAVLAVFNYVVIATGAPLVDDTFDTIDKSFGLDWVSWTQWVIAHPYIRHVLRAAYDSLPFQALFCIAYNTSTGAKSRNSEIWWITFISAVITVLISAVVPASNPYVYYGLENSDHFVHMRIFEGLRDGSISVVKFSNSSEGLVQLPSFHTILAIMFAYNLRHNRWLFVVALTINSLLILSCPSEGCHYFIDLPAGVAVAFATIWIVRRLAHVLEWEQDEAALGQPVHEALAVQR